VAKLGTVAHAYLFAGSRGTGKTSVARIFARGIGTSSADLYELDAASNRGIDDVRAIREAVSALPFESRYKVYIVDEVHMLTKEAFNALLKTLEEPPSHVVFILATTEMEKLPETVVSRCQVFQFKKPSQEVLAETVLRVAKAERFSLDRESAELIALLGDGSFRDALGILQKVMGSSADRRVSREEVESVVGAPRNTLINAFVEAVHAKDSAKGLEAIRKAFEGNVDAKVFLRLVLRKLRFVLLLRYAPDMEKGIGDELSAEDFALLSRLALQHGSGISAAAILAFLDAYENIGFAYLPTLPLELALLKACGEKSGPSPA
jgi:DNA polymerase-3 subunit gamma/tau